MKTAVIFDLYKTLLFQERDQKPYFQLCKSVGEMSHLRKSLIIDATNLQLFCEAIPINPPANLPKLQENLNSDLCSIKLFPEVLDVLKQLKAQGLKIAVISNLATPYIAPFYDLKLNELIDVAVFSCKIGKTKPDPEIYEVALNQLSATPDETLMIGDSHRCDVDGPRSLGIDANQIMREESPVKTDCISSLNEVFEYI